MKTELQIRQALSAANLCGTSLPKEDPEVQVYAAICTALTWVLGEPHGETIDKIVAFVRERKRRIAEEN